MIKLPMIGTEERTESSEFQVALVDKTNKSLLSSEQPRTNRYFDDLNDRNTFINMLESAINKSGGKLVHKVRMSHPLFESFAIVDSRGIEKYALTIYRKM